MNHAHADPDMAPASLDEAYMNLTPYIKRTGMTPETAIQQMREEVLQETGLTVSAGCGANTMLAKIAADVNKPNGQCIVGGDLLMVATKILEQDRQAEPSPVLLPADRTYRSSGKSFHARPVRSQDPRGERLLFCPIM